jgi:hypothetical protein
MKNFGNFIVFAILISCVSFSCKNQGQPGKVSVTGRAGEVIVVISNESWDSLPGRLIRETLAQPQLSLPQAEPLFDLADVPQEGFKNIFKTTRNIVITKISSTVEQPGVVFKNDIWAAPQATVEINAKDYSQFQDLWNENSVKIISYFLTGERNRLIGSYKKIHDNAIFNVLKEKYQISFYCQPGFVIASQKDDFLWIKYETPEISQGIFFYTIPYDNDSIFTSDYLIKKRDELLKKYVPGPTEGSYMSTEHQVEPVFNILRHNGNYAAEIRSLWNVENDFMGGPFILLAELDAANQRVVVADGYVYAPSKNKRNYLRQVEAMIYSMKFDNQEKNDKINREMNMEN